MNGKGAEMNFHRTSLRALVLLTIAAGMASTACARSPKIKLSTFKPRIAPAHAEHVMEVRYKIKVKRTAPAPLDLVVELSERGRPITDAGGRPLQFVIPIDHPTKVRKNKLEYEGSTLVPVPVGGFFDSKRLRADGRLFIRGSEWPIDQKDTRVKFERRRSPRYGVGYGFYGAFVGVSF